MPKQIPPHIDASFAPHWSFRAGITYLNHGSFGPAPAPVLEAQRQFQRRMQDNPMDYFVRELPRQLLSARAKLGDFVDADPEDLTFCDNATAGMNIVANSIALRDGDEVLVSNHEYGAVLRVWERACKAAGAKLVVVDLPLPFRTSQEIVDPLVAAMNARTKIVVVSHITSPTAIIFPVEGICAAARQLGIPVCIDGPHAIAMLPVSLRKLNCDYYAASCHKWLSAPFGSGFLYIRKEHQAGIRAPLLSWGRPHPGQGPRWQDEFDWQGTRDYSPWLSIPAAIDFLRGFGCERFRQQTHALAQFARQKLLEFTGLPPLTPDEANWYGSMAAVRLPDGPCEPLQQALWEQHGIEDPIVSFGTMRLIRVSCHLYTNCEQIDRLVDAVPHLLDREKSGT